jgi:hypothetical protein
VVASVAAVLEVVASGASRRAIDCTGKSVSPSMYLGAFVSIAPRRLASRYFFTVILAAILLNSSREIILRSSNWCSLV